jgi:hypothetical protein
LAPLREIPSLTLSFPEKFCRTLIFAWVLGR